MDNLTFFVSLGIAEISEILKLLLIFKLSFSKLFRKNLKYASTANIREIMQFYNLDDKSFETVFNLIQAGVFWNHIGWEGAYCAPSVSPLFVVQLQPNLA